MPADAPTGCAPATVHSRSSAAHSTVTAPRGFEDGRPPQSSLRATARMGTDGAAKGGRYGVGVRRGERGDEGWLVAGVSAAVGTLRAE